MLHIDTSSRTEQRKFGFVMAAAIVILGAARWGIGYVLHGASTGGYPIVFLYVAAPFLVLAVISPRVLQPVLVVWIAFANVVNWVVTHTLLGLVFFGLVVPTRLAMMLFRKDPLERRWDAHAATYWEEPEEQPEAFERYTKQF